MELNGLIIPADLESGLLGGEWPFKVPNQAADLIFPEPSFRVRFFDTERLRAINGRWLSVHPSLLGPPGQAGSLRSEASLVIGELGPEQVVALDYENLAQPAIVYLTSDACHRWVRIAPDFAQFARSLKAAVAASKDDLR